MSRPGLVMADGSTPLRREGSVFAAVTPYRGADPMSQELGGWFPVLNTPTGELWRSRDQLVARSRDLRRNNGFAAGVEHQLLDSVIGANWRLRPRPNWRALGIDYRTAIDWSRQVGARWRSYADDPGCWIHAARLLRFGGLLRAQFATWFMTGEHLSVGQWEPERIGPGRARWATCVQLVDPDRLSNPYGEPERIDLSMGVHRGLRYGEPLGYWIRNAHPADWVSSTEANRWTYTPRETAWGRPVVLHGFEVDRDGQVRGVPPFAPIIEALRLQDVFERHVAAGAILDAIYAAVIESQSGLSLEDAKEIFGADPETKELLPPNVDIRLRGVKVPVLPPGVKLDFRAPQRPAAAQFAQFEEAVLRRIAAGFGLSYEQVARDYSKTNYSSARASLGDAWKFMQGRSEFMASSFADHVYALWLEEEINMGGIDLPAGTPDFYDARADWVACTWIGPGRGWIDPTKEAQASQMKIDAGLSTREKEAAEQGEDWEEIDEQRAAEQAHEEELGLQGTGERLYRVNTSGGSDSRPPT